MSELHIPITIPKEKLKKTGIIRLYNREMKLLQEKEYSELRVRKRIIQKWTESHVNFFIVINPTVNVSEND
jgi:hypothetical protein